MPGLPCDPGPFRDFRRATWAVFLAANGAVNPDPANNRVFFEFVDSGGTVRGSTSTAVTTQ
jgi:hypothetical protein